MNSKTILGITISIAIFAGAITLVNLNPAIAGIGTIDQTERDNLLLTETKLKNGQIMVLVDNAGIGQTSDVELTWRFDPNKCQLNVATAPAPGLSPVVITDDGALGGNPAHRDWSAAEAVFLTTQPGEDCKIKPGKGEYISVSTVGSDP